MKKSFTLVAALAAIITLSAGTANASTTSTTGKHAKHASKKVMLKWFGNDVACDSNGGAHTVTYFFGIPISTGGTVPNSALCD